MSERCEVCKPEMPPDSPGAVPMPGVRHRSTCPLLPHLSSEAEDQLRADLAEMGRLRRRAEVESRNIMIAGFGTPAACRAVAEAES